MTGVTRHVRLTSDAVGWHPLALYDVGWKSDAVGWQSFARSDVGWWRSLVRFAGDAVGWQLVGRAARAIVTGVVGSLVAAM